MSWADLLPPFILGSSLLPGLVIFFLPESRRTLRTALNLASACVKLVAVAVLMAVVAAGGQPRWTRSPTWRVRRSGRASSGSSAFA
jgi:hypothetical protein